MQYFFIANSDDEKRPIRMTNKKVSKVGWIFTCKRFRLDLCCATSVVTHRQSRRAIW